MIKKLDDIPKKYILDTIESYYTIYIEQRIFDAFTKGLEADPRNTQLLTVINLIQSAPGKPLQDFQMELSFIYPANNPISQILEYYHCIVNKKLQSNDNIVSCIIQNPTENELNVLNDIISKEIIDRAKDYFSTVHLKIKEESYDAISRLAP